MPTLSRRHLMTTAAAVLPALALPAAVLPAAVLAKPITAPAELDPVIELAERAIKAYREFDEANARFQSFDSAMIEWREKNPAPRQRDVPVNSKQAFNFGTEHFFDIDGNPQVPVKFEASAEWEAAHEEHESNLARWKRRETAAKRRTGYAKAKKDEKEASERSTDAIFALIAAHPRTMAGLAAKARAGRITQDDGIWQEIVYDVGIMVGEVEPEADEIESDEVQS